MASNRSNRAQLSIRLDRENEEWLRLTAAIDQKTIADLLNELIKRERLSNPISVIRRAA